MGCWLLVVEVLWRMRSLGVGLVVKEPNIDYVVVAAT